MRIIESKQLRATQEGEAPSLTDGGRELADEREPSQTLPQSTDQDSQTSQPPWVKAAGGRKMIAYYISVFSTLLLSVTDQANELNLMAIQGGLALFVGGNAAEHKFKGDKK